MQPSQAIFRTWKSLTVREKAASTTRFSFSTCSSSVTSYSSTKGRLRSYTTSSEVTSLVRSARLATRFWFTRSNFIPEKSLVSHTSHTVSKSPGRVRTWVTSQPLTSNHSCWQSPTSWSSVTCTTP